MSAPPNGRFGPVRAFIRAHERFLLLTHVGPDGDGLLSCIAMTRYLRARGKTGTIVTEGLVPGWAASFDPEGLLRSREELLAEQDWVSRFDAVLVLDTGKPERLGRLGPHVVESGLPVAVLDHHIAEEGDFEGPKVLDTKAAAVGEMVLDLLEEEKDPFDDPLLVRCLLSALVYDTGQFRFNNTTSKTLRWAARLVEMGADPGEPYATFWESGRAGSVQLLGHLMSHLHLECGGRLAWFSLRTADLERFGVRRDETDEYTSVPRSIGTVEVVAFFSEIEGGRVRISLRSKGKVEIHDVAVKFGGGGHAFASGARVHGALDDISRQVADALAGKIRSVLGPD